MPNAFNVLRFIVIDLLWEGLYFFIWWYTKGVLRLVHHLKHHADSLVRSLNLKIVAKYLFVPMYGLTDIWSRIISFVLRLIWLIGATIITIIYLGFGLIVLAAWVSLPVVVGYNILYQWLALPHS